MAHTLSSISHAGAYRATTRPLPTRTRAEVITITALVIAAACLVADLSIKRVHAQPVMPAATASSRRLPMLEMHVANNGLVLLRGATVIRSDANRLAVTIRWAESDFTWVVLTDSSTRFIGSDGAHEQSSDVSVGDTLTVSGMMIGGPTPAMQAQYIRE
jgi:Arc/MetJ family transcription regulator